MDRQYIKLSGYNRALAKAAIDRAQDGWVVEIREDDRSLLQNRALHGLIKQIHRQRPIHNGQRMTPDLWKATFIQALGTELVMHPTLDGDGFFPLGRHSSKLTKAEFSNLIELMLAWCAREGLIIKHFDDRQWIIPEPSTLQRQGEAA